MTQRGPMAGRRPRTGRSDLGGRCRNRQRVTVTSLGSWRVYYPVHAVPYTPARHSPRGRTTRRSAPSCGSARTWPSGRGRRGSRTARSPRTAPTAPGRVPRRAGRGRAAVRDGAAAPPRTWARDADAHTPVDAARALAWDGPDDPGDWQPVTRTFRDGHAEPGGLPMPPWAGRRQRPAAGGRYRRPGHPAG